VSDSASPFESPRLLYVCFERMVPGSAATTHVQEIVDGLGRRGIAVDLVAEGGDRRSGDRFFRYFRVVGRSMAALRRTRAVFFRSHFAGLPVALLARVMRRPAIHEINGAYDDAFVTHPRFRMLRRMLAWAQRTQYRWASALVAVTPDLVSWGRQEAGHPRVTLVSNAANTTLFRPDGPRVEHKRPYVLFFGGLVRWHGIDVMLDAARSPAWPAGVDLVIAGAIVDESLRPQFERPPHNVVWLGGRRQKELPELIRGAVAALVPISDPEGRSSRGVMPLKMFEALACGTPVIVSELRGQADFVRETGCGLVVPVGDATALARAVAALAANAGYAKELGAKGARTVAAEHSWDARASEVARVVQAAIGAP
jgi:glycosyltransferase involved in cell wall biosynthesis